MRYRFDSAPIEDPNGKYVTHEAMIRSMHNLAEAKDHIIDVQKAAIRDLQKQLAERTAK